MANSAEDLEFNPYFKALQVRTRDNDRKQYMDCWRFQVRFSSLYERAQQNCWLVCIPCAASLRNCSINKQFTGKSLHLGKPASYLHLSVSLDPQRDTFWSHRYFSGSEL